MNMDIFNIYLYIYVINMDMIKFYIEIIDKKRK